MEGNTFEYIYETLEKRAKDIEKRIKYHKDRVVILESELQKIRETLDALSKGKL